MGSTRIEKLGGTLSFRLYSFTKLMILSSFTRLPGFLLLLGPIFPLGLDASEADRPNILWLTSEDNGPYLGCYGDSYAITPHLDRLAGDGILYTNAFATSPVCAPARFTLATGVYANSAGTEHMRSRHPIPDTLRFLSSYLREAGYYCTNNYKEDYNIARKPADAWDESSRDATYRNRSPEQPFFHVQNFMTSHESRLHRGTAPEWHDPANAPLPPYHPDLPETRETWAVYYDYMTRMDAEIGAMLARLEKDGLAEDTIVFYFSDHGGAVPGSKRFLFESGLRVPLIIRFPEKWRHLAPVDPGSRTERLVSFVDFPPTVLSLAKVAIPDHMQGQAFAGEFEKEPRTYAFGNRGRMDERDDRSRTVRDKRFRYTRNWMPFRPWGQHIEFLWRAPATEAWHRHFMAGETSPAQSRFFAVPKPGEELYDCLADPHNVHNLASDPAHQTTLSRMRVVLNEWISYTRDAGLLPEAEMIIRGREAGRTIHELVRSPDYPVDRLLRAANLASAATIADLPEILRLVGHSDPAVRYWVANAAIPLEPENAAFHEALLQLLEDASPSVSLAAAEALYRRGERDLIVPAYEEGLRHPEEMIRIQAISSLQTTDPEFAHRFVELVRERLANTGRRDYDARAFRHFLSEFSSAK
jgi:arylsulfatase A-like enzyme